MGLLVLCVVALTQCAARSKKTKHVMCGVYNATLAITVPTLVLAVYLNNKLVWRVAQHVNKLHRLIAALLGQLLKYLLHSFLQLLHTSYTVRTA